MVLELGTKMFKPRKVCCVAVTSFLQALVLLFRLSTTHMQVQAHLLGCGFLLLREGLELRKLVTLSPEIALYGLELFCLRSLFAL